MIPWFSKTEGNTYATLLHHPFLFGENQHSAQEVARRISGAVAGEVYAKVNIPSTHHIPLSPALHYLPFASRFPLPPIHPCRFIRPLSFSILPLYLPLLPVRSCLLAVMTSIISSPLSPESEVLNFKQREGENLKDAWYRIQCSK